MGSHVAFDVGAGIGEQVSQDCTGSFLVVTVFGWRSGSTECFLQESDADSFRPADLLECRWRPRLALHHLSKQCQANTDNFALFRQTRDRLFEEVSLLFRCVTDAVW